MGARGTPDFHEILDDIREKVVEEPTYGRAVTNGQGQARDPNATQAPAQAHAPQCDQTTGSFYGIQINIGDVTVDTSDRDQDIDIDTDDGATIDMSIDSVYYY